MALPLPNQLSTSTGLEPQPRCITALSTDLPSKYIDFFVDHAIEAAIRLPLSDEDVQRHCYALPSTTNPSCRSYGLYEREGVFRGGSAACDKESGLQNVLEDVVSVEKHQSYNLAVFEEVGVVLGCSQSQQSGLSENATIVDSVVERHIAMGADNTTSSATDAAMSNNAVSHGTIDREFITAAPTVSLDLTVPLVERVVAPASKSDRKQNGSKIDLDTLLKEDNMTFEAAVAKMSSNVVDTPPVTAVPAEPTVYLEDVHRRTIESLPSVCSVTDANLQDELLQNDYPRLPPLLQGQLRSWSDRPGAGTTRFSGWSTMCPHLEFKRAVNAIRFDVDGRYVNPSRVDPTILSARDTSGKSARFIAEVKVNHKWVTAVFTTPIRVLDSRLRTSDNEQKSISGAAHGQEWERMAAVFCMIMGESVLNAQVVGSELRFSTKLVAGSKSNTASSKIMVNTSPSPASLPMTRNMPSPNVKKLNGRSSKFVRSVLEASDTVPVFDARDHTSAFKFEASSLSQLEATLPLYTEEVPLGSLAVVAYTATYFVKGGDRAWSLSVNVQWIIILGSPM
ncbi:hypothetical protein AGABI1DRAFT_129993 [Agaricus bisporus var. burnettii JB137-S8]|uniref:Uncharacterized protein n=1 Tax=Agaricus bisporus var. burnettii (strain JB137-S8 / ATCC MYA-4627 / FGSC 10392) TaxID=597362 RepID=K5VTC7_AGABU|nr:uncharacterized protein AGABI1DRAFT_129993 [Agaricus bisporus var. burnettii JB137-S8]EKM77709.1 hypothetical protein AGABI1DRAFT_129993 [Agaricus bisporus var. burnettii JB137-S8]